MDNLHSSWYKEKEEKPSVLPKAKADSTDTWIYELELLQRVTKRVTQLAPHCYECQKYKSKIADIYINLDDVSNVDTDKKRSYSMILFDIACHLDEAHGLIISREKGWSSVLLGIVIGALPGLTFVFFTGTQEQDSGAGLGWTIAVAGMIIGAIIGLIGSDVLKKKI